MVKAIAKLQLLDVVAIKEDLPDRNLLAGQVGTIVEFRVSKVRRSEIVALFLGFKGSDAPYSYCCMSFENGYKLW